MCPDWNRYLIPVIPVLLNNSDKDQDRNNTSWNFYKYIREKIVYVYIKDLIYDLKNHQTIYAFPGES